jgi:hypothetical protein
MSFNVFRDPSSIPDPPGAPAAAAEARRRRTRQRATLGALGSAVLVLAAVVALRAPDDGRSVVANEPPVGRETAPTTMVDPTTSSPMESTTSTTTHHVTATSTPRPPATTTTTSSYEQDWVTHHGTADLSFSGVKSGPLTDAVATCTTRPNAESDLKVNGTLDGTPWVLYVQSYDGEMGGAWQVITGEAGGQTIGDDLNSSGYSATASYPQTLPGVTNVDWAHGATLDLDLASQPNQTPEGTVHVSGTITCS